MDQAQVRHSTASTVTQMFGTGAVRVLSSSDSDRGMWNDFLRRAAQGSFYHLFEWGAVNQEQLGARTFYLALTDAHDDIVGVMPLVLVQSRLFGRILCSMPFVNFGGPCAIDAGARTALARAAMAKADELQVDYLELRCTSPLDVGLPVSLRKISMTVKLEADPDSVWNSYTSKHRKNVKRAYKNGLEVVAGGQELLPEFYSVIEESWHTLGTPLYSADYFSAVVHAFPDNTRVFVCRKGSVPVAAAMTGYFNGVVEGLWAGGTRLARELDANYVLYWEMIRDACLRGCQSFHLGRSTAESGGEEFKRRWNAEAAQLYWYFYRPAGGDMPQLNVGNPRFRLAIAAWQRLPRWLVRIVGPHVARAIP